MSEGRRVRESERDGERRRKDDVAGGRKCGKQRRLGNREARKDEKRKEGKDKWGECVLKRIL